MVFGIGKMIASTKEAFIKARDGQEETEQPTIDRHISRAMREAEWEAEYLETLRERRYDEESRQSKMRRRILKEAGAKVDLLTDELIVGDARDIVGVACQIEVREDEQPSEIEVEWQPLTKAGKLPKKIAKACVIWDYSRHSSIICHIGYTAECEPYTADVYLWFHGVCERSIKLRMSEGVLSIQ